MKQSPWATLNSSESFKKYDNDTTRYYSKQTKTATQMDNDQQSPCATLNSSEF